MKLLFWSALLLVLFSYLGYPAWLYFRVRFWARPILRSRIFPKVTIVVAAHDEARALPRKMCNLSELDYPEEMLKILIVSDGSTDETNDLLSEWETARHRKIILPAHSGKATALNHGIAEAHGDIVVFTDARQMLAPDALTELISNFADSSVGCVSGELITCQDSKLASSRGVGLYWQVEKSIRNWEGLVGSTVGATGALYAVRRKLLRPIPPETILDDVYIPLEVVRQGLRVVFDPAARVRDDLNCGVRQEFRRKVRTLMGNYQLLQLSPWLLTNSNPIRLEFICHKLLRLLVPFALVGMFLSTFWLRQNIYELALLLQVVFYATAVLSIFRGKFGIISRVADISLAFLVLNSAAAIAFLCFVTGRKAVWHVK